MYLICGAPKLTLELGAALNSHGISTTYLPLLGVAVDQKQFEVIGKCVNQFDYIVLPSPTCIDFFAPLLSLLTLPITFIVMGQSSYTQLKDYLLQYSVEHKILYPKNSSGVAALIDEVLLHSSNNLSQRLQGKILLLSGSHSSHTSDRLEVYLQQNGCCVTKIKFYQQQKQQLLPNSLKKYLTNPRMQGIIITSNIIVEWLFTLAADENCLPLLQNTNFIVLHANVANSLLNYGVIPHNITTAATASKLAIIDLLLRQNNL